MLWPTVCWILLSKAGIHRYLVLSKCLLEPKRTALYKDLCLYKSNLPVLVASYLGFKFSCVSLCKVPMWSYTLIQSMRRVFFLLQIIEEDASLVEIGPRFVLNLIKIFQGSFGGATLYENPHYQSPNMVSSFVFSFM